MNEQGIDLLQGLLGMLRGLKWYYWNCHWMSKGQPSYGDHLLFERLYSEQIDTQIDNLAEKITAYDPVSLQSLLMLDAFNRFLKPVHGHSGPIGGHEFAQNGLAMEKHFQNSIKQVYNILKKSNNLSLGMDDYLMTLANERETVIYLLSQRTRR